MIYIAAAYPVNVKKLISLKYTSCFETGCFSVRTQKNNDLVCCKSSQLKEQLKKFIILFQTIHFTLILALLNLLHGESVAGSSHLLESAGDL